MVYFMVLFSDLMTNIIILVTKPFSLVKDIFLLGTKTVVLVILTWLQLVKAFIKFHLDVLWTILIWTVAFVSLPVRILHALQRERMLEFRLQEIQLELESLIWENKEVDKRLQLAIKDRRIMETVFTEIEEEYDKAITKIDMLENELQVLKDENLRLNSNQGKERWDFNSQGDVSCKNIEDDDFVMDYAVSPWKSGFNGSGLTLQEFLLDTNAWDDESKGKIRKPVFVKSVKEAASSYPFPSQITPSNLVVNEALDQRRDIALSQSLFSTILSLLVGMIIWEADDPCMPLVVALFIVVGISLKSVVQFFSTIRNRPASDAVALLSFNCFILGTLTSPTLPTVARLVAPPALRLAYQFLRWLGFSS